MVEDLHTAPYVAPEPPAAEAAATPVPPPRTTPGMRPAMIVVGLAAVLVLGLIVVGAFSDHGPGSRSTPTRDLGKVSGTSLLAVPALHALGPIEQPGQPPNNVLRALTVPAGATVVSSADNTSDNGYDEQVTFSSTASEAELLTFFSNELPRLGWKIESIGPATGITGSQQVLGQLAGSDGYFWEAGAVISPTIFPPGGPADGVTRFTLRLIQVSDDN